MPEEPENPEEVELTTLNPDLLTGNYFRDRLKELRIKVNNKTLYFNQVDVGFQSKPHSYPYGSIHTVESSAPIKRLGLGGGEQARTFTSKLIVSVEHEHHDSTFGYEELTVLRWEVFRHLLASIQVPGQDIRGKVDRAYYQTFVVDEGPQEDWGFYGHIMIPITIEFGWSFIDQLKKHADVIQPTDPDYTEPTLPIPLTAEQP